MEQLIEINDFFDDESKLIFEKRYNFYKNQDSDKGWFSLVELLACSYSSQLEKLYKTYATDYYKNLINAIDKTKKVVIFGCGYNGGKLFSQLNALCYNICYFLDNSKTKKSFENIPVIVPEDLINKDDYIIIVPIDIYEVEMYIQLITIGYAEKNIVKLKVDHNAQLGKLHFAFLLNKLQLKADYISSVLTNKSSKFYIHFPFLTVNLVSILLEKANLCFLGFIYTGEVVWSHDMRERILSHRLDFDDVLLNHNKNNDEFIICDISQYELLISQGFDESKLIPFINNLSMQYFEKDIIGLASTKQTTFIDAGAYDMQTSLDYISLYDKNPKKILAFEPNNKNYELCIDIINNRPELENISQVFNFGLWDKDVQLKFSQTEIPTASFISESVSQNTLVQNVSSENDIVIKCTSIDNILNNLSCHFIKMDIEGAELMALKGAENTIKKHTPILAISIYHNPCDIVTIPSYIKTINDNYNYYLRFYSMDYTEVVLYAIPKK